MIALFTKTTGFATMHIPHELQDEFPGEALFIEHLIKSDY
jgi:hypothetical protein